MEMNSLKQGPPTNKMPDYIGHHHLLNFHFYVMFPFENLGKVVALSKLLILH